MGLRRRKRKLLKRFRRSPWRRNLPSKNQQCKSPSRKTAKSQKSRTERSPKSQKSRNP
jgi:hypothetical protein